MWLVWRFEAGASLDALIGAKDFPYNLEVPLLGASLAGQVPDGPRRRAATVRALLRQARAWVSRCAHCPPGLMPAARRRQMPR